MAMKQIDLSAANIADWVEAGEPFAVGSAITRDVRVITGETYSRDLVIKGLRLAEAIAIRRARAEARAGANS